MDQDNSMTPEGHSRHSPFAPFSPGRGRKTQTPVRLADRLAQATPPSARLDWRQSPSNNGSTSSSRDREPPVSPFLDLKPEAQEQQRKLAEQFFSEENSPFMNRVLKSPTTSVAGPSGSMTRVLVRKPKTMPKLSDFYDEASDRKTKASSNDNVFGGDDSMRSPLDSFSFRRTNSQPRIDHTIPAHRPEHTVVAHREFSRTVSQSSLNLSQGGPSSQGSEMAMISSQEIGGESGSKWKGYYDYKNLRQRIKDYENSFKAAQGRKPKIEDINGDDAIVKMYKDYKKSKKAFEAFQATEQRQSGSLSSSTAAGATYSSHESYSSSRTTELLKTPTKSSRTRDVVARTPTMESGRTRQDDDALFKTPTMPSRTRDAVFNRTPTMHSRTRDAIPTTPTRASSRTTVASPFKSPAMSFRTIRALSPVVEDRAIPTLAGPSILDTEAIPRTPTKQRTVNALVSTPTKSPSSKTIMMRTPTGGHQAVEFVSPRKIVNRAGFMSPGRKTKESEDRFQYLTEITGSTPKTQRTRRSSLLSSPSANSGLFAPASPNPPNPPTPGSAQSAQSEVSLLRVPAGFNSFNRRRQFMPVPFMATQEDDERFEREFFNQENKTKHSSLPDIGDTAGSQIKRPTDANDVATHGATDFSVIDNGNDYSVQDDNPQHGSGSEDDNPFVTNTRSATAPKKKYTQKRSTRLHKIAVAPSEKAVKAMAASKPVRVSRRKAATAAVAATTPQDAISATVEENAADIIETGIEQESAPSEPSTIPVKEPSKPAKEDTIGSGWANSNKPMVKSDRKMPGRAGAKKSSSSYSGGGGGGDGNFVSYNLQRGGGFKKGGAYGKGRFGQKPAFGTGSLATGRTAFDPDQWRDEYDKEFKDSDIPSNLDLTGLERDEEVPLERPSETGLPWYGNVEDESDPFVVLISQRYIRQQFGEMNDPEEFVKALELQSCPGEPDDETEDSNSRPSRPSNEFRVNLKHILHEVWGYPAFRDGQFESIKRVLTGQSSLLVLPTGSGKSLTYQLPAYVFSKLGAPSLALVISPMISLMQDQVKCLPRELKGAAWTSIEQTTAQFKAFMDSLKTNAIKILFISPEKLQTPSFLTLVRTRAIPRISFVCVDEVHCMSEWSHNFRPAYLLLNHVLKSDLNSPCVLGLTGTATEGTKDSICQMLEIDRRDGVLSGPVIRENLTMTVSLEADRQAALLNLLQSPRFERMESILIYVMKKKEADDLAAFLRVRHFSAESYHAGKSSEDRQRIQNRFMYYAKDQQTIASTLGSDQDPKKKVTGSGGGIRILCATIAFGLGLNKSNIRSVIHFCMPKSIENYIQEIGRSGRDGKKSYCHMFLIKDDYLRLRSWGYADGMDWGSVLRLVKKLFSRRDIEAAGGLTKSSTRTGNGLSLTQRLSAATAKKRKTPDEDGDASDAASSDDVVSQTGTKKRKQNDSRALKLKGSASKSKPVDPIMSTSSIVAIPPPNTSVLENPPRIVVVREDRAREEFDIKGEVMATLLSYIELDESHPIKVQGSVSAKCTVKFLKESEILSQLADELPLMDLILKQGVLTGHNFNSGSSYGNRGKRGARTTSTLSTAYQCSTMSLCQQLDMSFTELNQELQRWKYKKWAVFEMTEPSLCVQILKEPTDCMRTQRRSEQGSSTMDLDEDDTRDAEEYEDDHDAFVNELSERLYKKMCAVERVGVAKVDQVYGLFHSVATPTWQEQGVFQQWVQDVVDEDEEEEDEAEEGDPFGGNSLKSLAQRRSRKTTIARRHEDVTEAELVLRAGIQEYFDRQSGEGIGGIHAEEELFATPRMDAENKEIRDKTLRMYSYENQIVMEMQRQWKSAAEIDLKVFLSQQHQLQQSSSGINGGGGGMKTIESPRVVSRIFHGIDSPCYPALEWYKNKYWGKLFHFDFSQLMLMADTILKDMRRKRAQSASQGSTSLSQRQISDRRDDEDSGEE